MDALLLSIITFVVIGTFVYNIRRYKKTAYYQITKQSRWLMDKGARGEYLLYESLRHFEKNGGKFLFNLYLPKRNNGTTEIDALLICSNGLFVFESKNYSGWVFGNEVNKNWTQTFPLGRGRSHKERFYNPIMQNATHITHLRPFIGGSTPVWSIIVFSDECTLKDITIKSRDVHVINRYHAASTIAQICDRTQADILTEVEINEIYNKLYPYTQLGAQEKRQHAKSIKNSPYR